MPWEASILCPLSKVPHSQGGKRFPGSSLKNRVQLFPLGLDTPEGLRVAQATGWTGAVSFTIAPVSPLPLFLGRAATLKINVPGAERAETLGKDPIMTVEVGHLEIVKKPGKPVVYLGEISMPEFTGDICLTPYEKDESRKPTAPTHKVMLRTEGGGWFHGGNSWRKAMKVGPFFHSVTIDGPGFRAPIYLAGFPDDDQPKETKADDPAMFTLKWGRPRSNRGAGSQTAAASIGDEIPY